MTAVPSSPLAASDAELVGATLEGDDRAFAELYRRHAGAVHLAVADRERDPDAVADAVQETFARGLDRLDDLRERDRFRPWLLSIARNVAIDRRRHDGRVRTEPIEPDEDHHDHLIERSRGPAEQASLAELASLVRGCVAGLSSRDATAVAMATWLGLGPAEIAAAFDIKHGAAKVLLHRARRRLRDRVVLEVAAAQRRGGCPQLQELRADEDEVAALRHVRSCPRCEGQTRSALGLTPNLDEPAATEV